MDLDEVGVYGQAKKQADTRLPENKEKLFSTPKSASLTENIRCINQWKDKVQGRCDGWE